MEAETPSFGGKVLIHKTQLYIISMNMIFGIFLYGREWRHALACSLIALCYRSTSGMCSEAESVFSDTSIFSKAVLIGTNSLSMSDAVTLNHLFVCRAFTFVTHWTSWLVVLLWRVSAVVNLRCRLIGVRNGIRFTKITSTLSVIFLFSSKIACGTAT